MAEERRAGPPPPPPPPPPPNPGPFPFAFWTGAHAVVSSIEPAGGPTAGGTNVTLKGSGFLGQTSASVGGIPLTGVSVVDDGTITGTTGAGMTADRMLDVEVGGGQPLVKGFSTMVATNWLRGPFVPIQKWVDEGSAGTSPLYYDSPGATVSAGTPVDGFAPAVYSFVGGVLTQSLAEVLASPGTQVDISNVVAVAGYTVMGVVRVRNSVVAQTNVYQNPTLIQGDARFGVFFFDAGGGTGQIGVYHFTGSFESVTAAFPMNTYVFYCCRYSAALGKAQIDVDATAGALTPIDGLASLAGVNTTTGGGTFNATTANATFDLLERKCLQSFVPDAQRDSYYGYVKARYPSLGLP